MSWKPYEGHGRSQGRPRTRWAGSFETFAGGDWTSIARNGLNGLFCEMCTLRLMVINVLLGAGRFITNRRFETWLGTFHQPCLGTTGPRVSYERPVVGTWAANAWFLLIFSFGRLAGVLHPTWELTHSLYVSVTVYEAGSLGPSRHLRRTLDMTCA